MKILYLYSTPIILEEGDLIATEKNRLWIRSGDDIYTSIEPISKLNLESQFYVSSAGHFSKDEKILPKLNWEKYKPTSR